MVLRCWKRQNVVKVAAIVLMELFVILLWGGENLVSAQNQAASTIRIGAAISFSGPLAREGNSIAKGYELWAEEANEHGGLDVGGKKYKVQLKLLDDKGDSSTGVKLVEKLITDDKVEFVFGPYGSGMTIAASAVNEKYKKLMIAPMANAPDVYKRGFKYLFGLLPPANRGAGNHVNILRFLEPKPKTVAVVYPDDLFPSSTAKGIKEEAEKQGFKVVYFEKYPKGSKDLTPIISALQPIKPDVFITTGYMEDSVLLVRTSREMRFNVKYFGGLDLFLHEDFLKALGNDAEDLFSHAWWDKVANMKSDVFGSANKVIELYETKHHTEPNYYTISGVATGEVLQSALTKAGSLETDKIRAALLKNQFHTSLLAVKYDDTGANSSGSGVLIQIQKGKPVVVYPQELQQAKPVYPKPPWGNK